MAGQATDIGFIGLGTMGGAIAENLLRAGHGLTVWNRTPEAADRLKALGATVAQRPEGALQGRIAFTMLANDKAISDVGLDGPLLEHAAPGLVLGNLTTVSVAFARSLAVQYAQKRLGYVATTVFGRADAAATGRLTVVAAGPAEAVAQIRPLLDIIGQRVVIIGETPEQANLFKLAGNFMLASVIETIGEAQALARKGGIDPALFHDIMTGSLFGGVAFKGYGALIMEGKYDPPGFSLRLGLKDVDLALTAASELTVPMPLASLMHNQFVEAMNSGLSNKDWVSLASLIARKAGLGTL